MNCRDLEERLALYLGGDLSPSEAVEVERHLVECPGCQVFSSGLKEARELLLESHREPLAPAHLAAVRARVLAELERQKRPFWQRGWVFGFAAVAAAVLVMLAVRPGPRPVQKPPVVATEHQPVPSVPAASDSQGTDGISGTQRVAQQGAPRKVRPRPKGRPGDPVLVRIVSNDPDVVIYWIADTRGD